MVVFAMVASACGGGDSGGDTTAPEVSDSAATNDTGVSDDGSTTFTINDVVVTLDIPDGAIAAGTEIEIADGNLPPGLAQISEIEAYVFDLKPSGLEFSEPATITFRLAAPGDTGTPLFFVIIESEEGTANILSSEVTRQGDEVQVSALIDHFSQAYLVLPDGTEVVLTPELLQMRVGESGLSEMKFRQGQETSFTSFSATHAYFYEDGFDLNVLPVASGFITATFKGLKIEVTCLKETDGVIENAYEAIVESDSSEHPWMDGITGSLAGETSRRQIRLLGDVRCDAVAATTTTSAQALATPGQDPRAHIASVDPVTTANSTQGVVVGFGQPWGSMPPSDLFSFFFKVDIVAGDCSTTAGWETHAGSVIALGPGPTYLLDNGSVLIDTGCGINPGAPIDITGQSGSWEDESTTQPVFADFVFHIDPAAIGEAPEPIDMSRVVYDLVDQTEMPGGGPP